MPLTINSQHPSKPNNSQHTGKHSQSYPSHPTQSPRNHSHDRQPKLPNPTQPPSRHTCPSIPLLPPVKNPSLPANSSRHSPASTRRTSAARATCWSLHPKTTHLPMRALSSAIQRDGGGGGMARPADVVVAGGLGLWDREAAEEAKGLLCCRVGVDGRWDVAKAGRRRWRGGMLAVVGDGPVVPGWGVGDTGVVGGLWK